MLKSMTGFGRGQVSTSFGRVAVEIHSVNRRFLEVPVFIPQELVRFENDVRRWVSSKVARGHVTVRVSVVFDTGIPLEVKANIPLARETVRAIEKLSQSLNLEKEQPISLSWLGSQEGILQVADDMQDEELYRKGVYDACALALDKLIAMKEYEGKSLQSDLEQRLSLLEQKIEQIALNTGQATERYREKLKARLEEVVPGQEIGNEERLLREICVYAERIDITEEITRFRAHLKQCQKVLEGTGSEGAGKTLDFIVQELNREVNTIASKASDYNIAKIVVEIKSELERVREQIQNIE